MGKETPNYTIISEILQRRTDRLQADRQLRHIIENGGISPIVFAEAAKALAPLTQKIALLQQELEVLREEIAKLKKLPTL